MGTKISLPNTAPYIQSIGTFFSEQNNAITPACVVSATSTKDVQEAVGILSTLSLVGKFSGHGCQFAVRSGGHTPWAGSATIQDGVDIDLSALNHITPSEDKKTVSIGPGNRWVDVYLKLDALGLGVSGGRVASVGVGGLTTGGGMSFFAPRYGFVCDTVTEFEVRRKSRIYIFGCCFAHMPRLSLHLAKLSLQTRRPTRPSGRLSREAATTSASSPALTSKFSLKVNSGVELSFIRCPRLHSNLLLSSTSMARRTSTSMVPLSIAMPTTKTKEAGLSPTTMNIRMLRSTHLLLMSLPASSLSCSAPCASATCPTLPLRWRPVLPMGEAKSSTLRHMRTTWKPSPTYSTKSTLHYSLLLKLKTLFGLFRFSHCQPRSRSGVMLMAGTPSASMSRVATLFVSYAIFSHFC